MLVIEKSKKCAGLSGKSGWKTSLVKMLEQQALRLA